MAINHQLHFHPRRQILQQFVAEGKIGQVCFIEASARMNMAFQGTHILQSIGAFNPGGAPTSVFAQAAGGAGLQENTRRHYAPDETLAVIGYDNGVRAVLHCGAGAPMVIDDPITHKHKRIAVYGRRGYVQWTMWSWETSCDGVLDGGTHLYADEDIVGQAAMTEAMFDWLLDEGRVHPLNLDAALRDFNVLLGAYMSALHRQPITLPVEPEQNLLAALREELGSAR
jgi:predicted dehydrogenase